MIKNSNNTVKFEYTQNKTEPLTDEELKERITLAGSKKFNETAIANMKKRVGEVKQKEKKLALKVDKEDVIPLPLNDTQLKQAKAKLDSLDKNDVIRIKTMERRDFLESFLFDKKEWLDGKDAMTVKYLLNEANAKR